MLISFTQDMIEFTFGLGPIIATIVMIIAIFNLWHLRIRTRRQLRMGSHGDVYEHHTACRERDFRIRTLIIVWGLIFVVCLVVDAVLLF